MLIGVPGSGQGPQPQPAQIDLVAVGERGVLEGAMPGCRGQHSGALVGGQLHGPGQEISVQVRVGSERHPQAPPGGGLAQGPQVARRVDGQRPPVAQVSQVGGVPQALIDQRDHMVTGIAHQALQQQRVNTVLDLTIF